MSADQEHHVFMSTTAARQAWQIYENALWVLVLELA